MTMMGYTPDQQHVQLMLDIASRLFPRNASYNLNMLKVFVGATLVGNPGIKGVQGGIPRGYLYKQLRSFLVGGF